MYAVEHKTPGNPSPIEWDLIGADHLPHLRVTEHLIGHRPATACLIGNYTASPLPFPGDAASNAMPPPPLPSPPSPSSSPSSPDRHIPRACHGVERRQRSRPSSRGRTDYFSRLARAERAAFKTASSRRVTYAHQSHQIASSSLWTAPNDAPPTSTATARPKRHRPPIPTPITPSHIADLSLTHTSFDYEREDSPGFDADVEFEPADDVIRRDHRARVGAKERLTIIIPGGKSEAYVAMAFERSCSLAADDDDNDDSALRRGMSSLLPSPSFIPPPSTERHLLAPEGVTSREKGKGKTGLKIKIPLPSPLYMLSLRMAGSCRVSEEAAVAVTECPSSCPGALTGFPESGYSSSTASTSSSAALGSCSDNAIMMTSTSQDRHQDHRGSGPLLVRGGASAASYRSHALATATALPPRSPSLEGRVARRIARRAALAPYCRLPVARSQRPYLVPY